MITQALLNFFSSAFATVFGWLPTFTLPSWYAQIADGWETWVVPNMLGVGNWFPLPAIYDGLTFVAIATVASITTRLVRIALSMISGGGGSL